MWASRLSPNPVTDTCRGILDRTRGLYPPQRRPVYPHRRALPAGLSVLDEKRSITRVKRRGAGAAEWAKRDLSKQSAM
jgi:hypothetical protein